MNENDVRVVPDMVRSSLCKRERLADSISGLGLSRACLHHTMGLKAFCRGLFNFASYNLQKHKLELVTWHKHTLITYLAHTHLTKKHAEW